jgi:hypothetical protein
MRQDAEHWVEPAGHRAPATARYLASAQRELGEPAEVRVIREHPVQDRGPGVIRPEQEHGRGLGL